MDNIIYSFHTLIRRFCMDRRDKLKSKRSVAQLKALSIYEETQNMTEEQVVQSIYEKIISLNREEAIEIENNQKLRKASCGINIDILEIILQNVEKLEPERYSKLNEIKSVTIGIVKSSKINETRNYVGWSVEHKKNISEREIDQLVTFIGNIDENDLKDVPPLFYRRVLSKEEEREVLSKLQNKWFVKIDQQYNLANREILNINSGDFAAIVDRERMVDLIIDRGEKRIYEINMCELDAASYIMDTHAMLKSKNIQTYWCSDKMDWAIIKDHDGFFFICGEFLINTCNTKNIFYADAEN